MDVSVMQIIIYSTIIMLAGSVIGAGIALLMFAHSYMREEEKRLRNDHEIR
jgi:hypothetical protein